jgi:hypothetical protein
MAERMKKLTYLPWFSFNAMTHRSDPILCSNFSEIQRFVSDCARQIFDMPNLEMPFILPNSAGRPMHHVQFEMADVTTDRR